jgi:hypothetical protein
VGLCNNERTAIRTLSEETAMLRYILLAVFLDLKGQVQSVRVQETGNSFDCFCARHRGFCREQSDQSNFYEGDSNENLKSAIKIQNTARLSCKLTIMILMV